MAASPVSPWERLGRQLQHPTGFAGRLVGHAMDIANRRPNAAAVAALDIQPGDDILELGFGPGSAIKVMAALAPRGRIYGVDKSQAMLDLARRRNGAAIRAGQVVLMQGAFESLPLPAASVGKILAVNVIYFWRDARAVLAEMQRVLRPGGRIAIYATDAAAMRRWKFAGPDTHRTFGREELAALLHGGGFDAGSVSVRQVRPGLNVCGWVATASKGR